MFLDFGPDIVIKIIDDFRSSLLVSTNHTKDERFIIKRLKNPILLINFDTPNIPQARQNVRAYSPQEMMAAENASVGL